MNDRRHLKVLSLLVKKHCAALGNLGETMGFLVK